MTICFKISISLLLIDLMKQAATFVIMEDICFGIFQPHPQKYNHFGPEETRQTPALFRRGATVLPSTNRWLSARLQ